MHLAETARCTLVEQTQNSWRFSKHLIVCHSFQLHADCISCFHKNGRRVIFRHLSCATMLTAPSASSCLGQVSLSSHTFAQSVFCTCWAVTTAQRVTKAHVAKTWNYAGWILRWAQNLNANPCERHSWETFLRERSLTIHLRQSPRLCCSLFACFAKPLHLRTNRRGLLIMTAVCERHPIQRKILPTQVQCVRTKYH